MSTTVAATLLLIGLFLVLVFLRVPIVYAIGIASLADFFYLGINPMQMALKFVGNLNSYTLLAVPFFILMGELMSAGGITDTLIDFSKELVGWFRGGACLLYTSGRTPSLNMRVGYTACSGFPRQNPEAASIPPLQRLPSCPRRRKWMYRLI